MELTKTHLWKFMLVAGLCAVGCYFALPSRDAQYIAGAVIGFVSVLCIVGGIVLNRPEDRVSWLLLAGGGFCFFAAEGVWNLARAVLHAPIRLPVPRGWALPDGVRAHLRRRLAPVAKPEPVGPPRGLRRLGHRHHRRPRTHVVFRDGPRGPQPLPRAVLPWP